MGKSTNFSGQPIFNKLLKFIDKSEIRKIAKRHDAERYVKKFTNYHHVVVMLFVAIEGYHSLRETILGLLADAHKLSHLGLSYLVAHTIIKASENVPCLIRYSEAVRHDHMFLAEVHNLAPGSIITFDKGYVD